MDDSQFVAAVSPYINDMLHLAIALIGAAEAEDITQEALLRAWQAASSLRAGDTVRAWLLCITANVCHDWYRGRNGTRVRLAAPLPHPPEGASALLATGESDPGSSTAVLRLDMRRLVDQLDEELRVVVVLRYYVDMNATEIGAALGLPASTARTRLQRALVRLRTLTERQVTHLRERTDP